VFTSELASEKPKRSRLDYEKAVRWLRTSLVLTMGKAGPEDIQKTVDELLDKKKGGNFFERTLKKGKNNLVYKAAFEAEDGDRAELRDILRDTAEAAVSEQELTQILGEAAGYLYLGRIPPSAHLKSLIRAVRHFRVGRVAREIGAFVERPEAVAAQILFRSGLGARSEYGIDVQVEQMKAQMNDLSDNQIRFTENKAADVAVITHDLPEKELLVSMLNVDMVFFDIKSMFLNRASDNFLQNGMRLFQLFRIKWDC